MHTVPSQSYQTLIPACGVMRQSQLFTRTRRETSESEPSINAQLLERGGFVSKLMAGVYSYLPLGNRVLQKIEQIVREEMNRIGGQEVLMPSLQPREIWDTTGRWEKVDVLFRFKGAGDRDLALGPTHEEVVTPLVQSFVSSYRDLPQAVYQIQTKFRNEARAKSGLLRGREFRMKDLYSFHATVEELDTYYEEALQAYHRVFARVGLGKETFLTFASGGVFSKYSHEFQTVTEHGEDVIYLSPETGIAVNKEVLEEVDDPAIVGNKANLQEKKAIEVGNIFKLMTRFSDAFKMSYQDSTGQKLPVYMGCYGIGTSRLMGSIVEVLHDDKGPIWPLSVAPFAVHIVDISRNPEGRAKSIALCEELAAAGVEVLLDDRDGLTAGIKFADSDLIGIPYRIVVSDRLLASNSLEVKVRGSAEAHTLAEAEAKAMVYQGCGIRL